MRYTPPYHELGDHHLAIKRDLRRRFFDGVAETRLGWKDTVIVPRESILRFAVRYGGRGTWMFHCHVLEHAELGMTGALAVSP